MNKSSLKVNLEYIWWKYEGYFVLAAVLFCIGMSLHSLFSGQTSPYVTTESEIASNVIKAIT